MRGEHHNVATAILIQGDCVLLCHRHPQRRWYPDVWDMPGGHIHTSESPADALRRELQEELGVNVELPDDEPWRVLTPTAELTLHVWVIDQWRGIIENRAVDEHDEIRWFRPEEAGDLELADDFLADLIIAATTS